MQQHADLRVLERVWQEAGFDLSDPRFTMIANDAGDLRAGVCSPQWKLQEAAKAEDTKALFQRCPAP